MPVLTSPKPSMASGEIGEKLYGRHDFQRYDTGLARVSNYVIRPQGGATRRAPTEFIRETTAESVLKPYEFSRTDSYIIELLNGTYQFYRDGGIVETSPGVPYTAVSPYVTADLPNVRHAKSGDVVYFFHPSARNVQKLQRFGDTNWVPVPAAFSAGPFLDENIDDAKTVQASAASGSGITLTAVGHTFDDGQIGSLFRIREKDLSSPGKWAGNVAVSANDQVRSNDKIYLAVAGGNTGPNPPDHLEGDEQSGPTFVTWRFVRLEFGVVEITAVAGDGLTATADVVLQLPDDAVSAPTPNWSEGAFSELRGYPETGVFQQQRFTLGKSSFLFGSRVSDFENMLLDGDPDGAFVERVGSGTQRSNDIAWLAAGDIMAIGTSGEEYTLQSASANSALTATSLKIPPATTEGSIPTDPVRVGSDVLSVSKDGRRLMRFFFDDRQNAFQSDDVSIQSDHLTAPGIKKIQWQRDPLRVMWILLTDGNLRGFTYNRTQEMLAWHRHDVGGFVEDIAVIPSSDGTYDELWLKVRRVVQGQTRYFIERTLRYFDPEVDTDPAATPYLDCQLSMTFPEAVTTVSGFDHLEGETIGLVVDGSAYDGVVVVNGQVTLPRPGRSVAGGKPMRSWLRFLPTQSDFADGPIEGRTRQIKGMSIRMHGAPGGLVGNIDRRPDLLENLHAWDGDMDTPPALFKGQKEVHVDDGWQIEDFIDLVVDGPLALDILSAPKIVDVSEA